VLLLVALGGCGPDVAKVVDPGMPDIALPPALACAPDQLGDAGVPASWANLELIIDNNCGTATCHYPGFPVPGGTGLDLSHGHAYADLVGKTAQDLPNRCGGVQAALISDLHARVSRPRGLVVGARRGLVAA